MGSNKTSKKTKKPIETTLGKCPKDTGDDDSHLGKPIETSVNGIKHIVALWESATLEVKDLLSFECDIMYECRVCRSIFRSLANFLLHKRKYCTDKFLVSHQLNNNDLFEVNSTSTENSSGLQPLEKVVQKLHEIDQVRKCAEKFSTVDLSNQDPLKNMKELEVRIYEPNKTVIENIDSNSAAVFQTILNGPTDPNVTTRKEFMKTEVMEIHKKMQNDVPVLDAEGKICALTSTKYLQPSLYPKSDLKCTECNNQFATQKSLTTHMKLVHNPSRILYVCPTCKDTFANPWCVYRHLLKVHRLTNKQVRRMREQVHNSWVRRDEIAAVPKKQENKAVEDRENQWINDIEGDNDFQYCVGCGKHFERKAALHSHSQMCAKRLEVCNNIKEMAKKKEEEAIEKAKLEKATADDKTVKGASKRKGRIIHTYRREQNVWSPSNSVDEAICLSSSDETCKSPLVPAEEEDQGNFPKTTKFSVVPDNFNQLDPEDLLRNDVSFETFCKSVESEIKRETDTPIELEHCDTDDDVIFVNESSPASLSNLSHNNPLKFKQAQKRKLKRKKIMSKSVANKRAPKSELDLLSRASAYVDRTKLRCIPCGKSFQSLKLLLYHMAAHFSWFRFQCAKCTFVTYSKLDCITHCRKQHKMTENLVLPIPTWKSIFMSHDFRLLDDSRKLRGRHTDENITSEDSEQFHTENGVEDTVEESCMLFEENLLDVKEEKDLQLDPETLISGIDVQEHKDDRTVLPVPLELGMPADVHVTEMFSLNEDVELGEPNERVSACAVDETNDDWGLSQVCAKYRTGVVKNVPEEESSKPKALMNIRPARVRNKAKKDDNFLYYDNSTRSLVPF